jgi:hypothetical protein
MLRGREGGDASYIHKNQSRGSRPRDSKPLPNPLLHYTLKDDVTYYLAEFKQRIINKVLKTFYI